MKIKCFDGKKSYYEIWIENDPSANYAKVNNKDKNKDDNCY